jgi:hypothetical protein
MSRRRNRFTTLWTQLIRFLGTKTRHDRQSLRLEKPVFLCSLLIFCLTDTNRLWQQGSEPVCSGEDYSREKDDEVVEGVPFYAGMKLLKSGKWVYDITPEEQPYIDVEKLCHSLFAAPVPDWSDRENKDTMRLLKKTLAEGLAVYAAVLFNKYKGEKEGQERKDEIEKGISALIRAGEVTHLPRYYIQAGQLAEAIKDEATIGSLYDCALGLCKKQDIPETDEIVQLVIQKLQAHYERIGLNPERYPVNIGVT